jgi:pimeloyl-ACP methyl ester carboxylesterase
VFVKKTSKIFDGLLSFNAQAFVVSHDWGAIVGWFLCLFRPERIIALASLSVYYLPHRRSGSLLQFM